MSDTHNEQANDCRHDSATGVDTMSPADPAKVWACDHCGLRWRQDGGSVVDTQRADHYEHLYAEASAGRCGYSGLALAACKGSICDCFDFPWVHATATDDTLGGDKLSTKSQSNDEPAAVLPLDATEGCTAYLTVGGRAWMAEVGADGQWGPWIPMRAA